MTDTTTAPEPASLTAKGQATRARILEHTAELIYRQGVHATNEVQVRRAAGVSGSQMSHYFPTKESLILAVIDWQAQGVLTRHRGHGLDRFDGLDGFREWADFYIGYERSFQEGCSLGSLASEIIKTDLDVHDRLAAAFDDWRHVFQDALQHLQARGVLNGAADPRRLANMLLAAFQGGTLLAQIAGEITPLEDALEAALAHLATFTASGAITAPEG